MIISCKRVIHIRSMVKFSKKLEAQLIPEWKGAFMNYWLLKKHLKKLKLLLRDSRKHDDDGSRRFDLSLVDNSLHWLFPNRHHHQASQNQKCKNDSQENKNCDLETTKRNKLTNLFTKEDEENAIFVLLEEELKKVNEFYKSEEEDFVERGEILKNQLQVLLDLKQILMERRTNFKLPPSSQFLLPPSYRRTPNNSSEPTTETHRHREAAASPEIKEESTSNVISSSSTTEATPTSKAKPKRSTTVKIDIDIPATNCSGSISAVMQSLWDELVNNPKEYESGEEINRRKLDLAEGMIKSAFVEFYRGLGLLQTYSSLNMVAFTKILKKFDKVTGERRSSNFLKFVRLSHFISSDKVSRTMNEVEYLFTKHFACDSRKRAMKLLRPPEHKDSHFVTFFVGFFTGCFVMMFTAYAILLQIYEVLSHPSKNYLQSVYPVFSIFALFSLHLFMYACNLYIWKRKRINYNFIFGFQASTSLRDKDVFLMSTSIMATVIGALVVHLILQASNLYPGQVDAIPAYVLLFFIVLLFWPFNIFYRSARFAFLRILRNIIFSPFYQVVMVDFFMADQLTSQIPLLRHMETTICYFLAGAFKTHKFETCQAGYSYTLLAYGISFMPYYWRAMQCTRQWIDDHSMEHVANMGKYASAMVAAGARITYATQGGNLWLSIVLVTSAGATVYQLYWDFFKDWGVLRPKSKNPWLRDELMLGSKRFYYISMGLNLILRVAWVQTVLPFKYDIVQSSLLQFLLASLEVIRRGQWNFYRVENEHLNNVGKFRAVKTVPLPFREE